MDLDADLVASLRTVAEMLRDRATPGVGDLIDRCEHPGAFLDSNSKLTFAFEAPEASLMVVCDTSSKFKVATIKKFLDAEGYSKFIVVAREKPSSNAVKTMSEYSDKSIQFFEMKELVFNVTKHCLVPKHEIVPDASIKSILEAYRIKHRTQLPLIYASDPVARYLGLAPGQVVRVTRTSAACGETFAYRCCVRSG
jgi:DNA-directed RNA polymerase subunit H (RpoH/RPB5)